jgi:excisionase family DNA binding protein
MPESDLLTFDAVAESLDVTPRTVRNFVAAGRLAAVKLGGLTRIQRAERDRFVRDLPPVKPRAQRADTDTAAPALRATIADGASADMPAGATREGRLS